MVLYAAAMRPEDLAKTSSRGLLAADLRAAVNPDIYTGVGYWLRVLAKALITPQLHAVILFRVSHALATSPLRPLAFIVRAFALAWTGAEIHPDAQIGPGLALMHTSGIVVGSGVVIGADCRLTSGVVLGETGRGGRNYAVFPTLGDHVTIGANAVVLGGHALGTGCVVGANAVVTADVAPGDVVGGVPARVISHVSLEELLRPIEW